MTCPHGMPKPSTCVDCMLDGPVAEPATWRTVGDLFAAKFDGALCTCGSATLIGEPIQRWDLGEPAQRTVYRHEGCKP